MDVNDGTPPELTPVEMARWAAMRAAVSDAARPLDASDGAGWQASGTGVDERPRPVASLPKLMRRVDEP